MGDIAMKPDYYNLPVPPVEYCIKNNLGFCAGNIVTLATTWDKRGTAKQDLLKVIQYATFLLETLEE